LLSRQVCGQRRWEVLIDAGKQQSMRRGATIEQDQILCLLVGSEGSASELMSQPTKYAGLRKERHTLELFRLVGYYAA
jgi:hypothetical protein